MLTTGKTLSKDSFRNARVGCCLQLGCRAPILPQLSEPLAVQPGRTCYRNSASSICAAGLPTRAVGGVFLPKQKSYNRAGRDRQVAAKATSKTQPDAVSSNQKEHYDVVVIGGGPAGLLAAKALLTALPNFSIKVFEAAPSYQPQGAGVLIEINGWRALHAVNGQLADRMRSRGILISGSDFMDERGEQLRFQLPNMDHEAITQEHGHTAAMVHWGDIRQVLYEALPTDLVSFDSRVVGLTAGQPDGAPAELHVQEPGAPDRSRVVTAGLVVAADGFYSRSKRLAFGASGPPLLPTFRNRIIWRALVRFTGPSDTPELLLKAGNEDKALWWLAEGQPPERSALVYPVNDNRYVWTCIAPDRDVEAAGLPPWSPHRGHDQDLGIQQIGTTGTNAKERCMAVFRNHPPEVQDLLSRTDPRAITEHGYYTYDVAAIRGAPDWVRGNVVVMGDAAHTGPPDGMGLNMAWEDAAVLAWELKRAGGVSTEALECYCSARLPRVHAVWSEPDLYKPRRAMAVRSAAFEPLGPGSSGPDKTRPLHPQQA